MRSVASVRPALAVALALVGVTVAGPALAQRCPAPPKTPPSAADIGEATKRMKGGVAFMELAEGPRYEEAYEQFRTAYVLSGSANALQNLAICAAKLELDGEAIECFQRYLELKGASLPPDEKAGLETDLRALESAVAWVTFSSDLPGITIEDTRTPRMGAVVRNTYKLGAQAIKVGLHPGNHTVVAALNGHPEQKWTVEVKPGEKLTKEFFFEVGKPVTAEGFTEADATAPPQPKEEPASKRGGGLPAQVWAVGGLTLATGIGWGVTGGLALSKKSAYEEANTPENLAAGVDLEAQRKTITTLNLVSDVLMGVTIAGAATTVVLGVLGSSDAKTARSGAETRWAVAPLLGGGTLGAAATGSF